MTEYLALIGFIAFMVGTPGPANLVCMLVGVNQGFHKCAGFVCGLIIGKLLLNLSIGYGFGFVLAGDAALRNTFAYVSAAYMVWLALRSWPRYECFAEHHANIPSKKIGFFEGVAVHPLNPKAWLMVVMTWGYFAPALGDFYLQLPVVLSSFALCQLVFHSLWCALGAYVGRSFAQNLFIAKSMVMLTILVVLAALFYSLSA